jgi:hypothetical protein
VADCGFCDPESLVSITRVSWLCYKTQNFLKRKSANVLIAAQRRGGGEPEQYAPDATRGCMENASLSTGANCKRYICTVVYNVMQFWTRGLFMHKTCIKIYRKIFSFLQAW